MDIILSHIIEREKFYLLQNVQLYVSAFSKVLVGVSLLLAPAGADKRDPKTAFPPVGYAGIQPARECLPKLWRELGLTESTVCTYQPLLIDF